MGEAFSFRIAYWVKILRFRMAPDGAQINSGNILNRHDSANGRYITFSSDANNLVLGDTNGYGDVFVRDRMTGQTSRVSVASDGTEPIITWGGRISQRMVVILYSSQANNLVNGTIIFGK